MGTGVHLFSISTGFSSVFHGQCKNFTCIAEITFHQGTLQGGNVSNAASSVDVSARGFLPRVCGKFLKGIARGIESYFLYGEAEICVPQ